MCDDRLLIINKKSVLPQYRALYYVTASTSAVNGRKREPSSVDWNLLEQSESSLDKQNNEVAVHRAILQERYENV